VTAPVQQSSVSKLNHLASPLARVLFLGYDRRQTCVIDELIRKGCEVWHTADNISSTQGYDFAVSFGYRHLIGKAVLAGPAPIINLHMAYLPWNRGAHPNFWSFYDGTASGVSIHLIDAGVDTGPVLYQRYVNFGSDETTFSLTYKRLVREIEELFVANIDEIIAQRYTPRAQRRNGTYHRAADLPKEFAGWDAEIESEIRRLDEIHRSTDRNPGS